MRYIYSIGIFFYHIAISLAAFIGNSKAKKWIKGRKNWKENLINNIPSDKKTVWFHCASLGEFEQARPLIEKIKSNNKETFIHLSFFSPSGFENIKHNFKDADLITYLPIDSKRNAREFIKLSKPSIAIFTKYEFWFNLLNELNQKEIPIILISSIFRKDQLFFKPFGTWFLKHLRMFKMIFTQESNSQKLLDSKDIKSIVAGDTRFDRVFSISQKTIELPISKENRTIIFGSSWEMEENFAVKASEDFKNLKIIIAPHEINDDKINHLKGRFKNNTILWDELLKHPESNFEVLIINKIGLLSSLYFYSNIAFIGGGFGKGIHNILEAAVFGNPILFGPKYKKFNEAKDLINLGGAKSINSYEEFKKELEKLLSNTTYFNSHSDQATQYIKSKTGATDSIFSFLNEKSLLY